LGDPVLVYKIGERHFCLLFEVAAKGGGAEVNGGGDGLYVWGFVVMGVDVLVNSSHTDLVVEK